MYLLPKVAYSESCNIAAIVPILQLLPELAYSESYNIAASGNIAANFKSCDHCVLYKVFWGKIYNTNS